MSGSANPPDTSPPDSPPADGALRGEPSKDDRLRERATALGLAAVSVAEALMILLVERGVVGRDDVEETLLDAIDTHANAEPAVFSLEEHKRAAELIRQLMTGANSIRPSGHL